jgi:serine phosphatase RsbU (regulator of sigma subunit)
VKAVNESDSSTAKSLVTDVLHRIEEYSSGAEQFDDITMLAVIYRGGENS